MADNTQPKPDEEIDYVGELADMKRTRKTPRGQITLTSNQIDTLTNTRGSRGAIQGLIIYLKDLLLRASRLQTEIAAMEVDEEEAERQDTKHLTYITSAGESTTAAQDYLRSSEGEAASVVGEGLIPEPPNTASPSEILRREQARQDEITVARLRAEIAKEQVDRAWEEANEAQKALRELGIEFKR